MKYRYILTGAALGVLLALGATPTQASPYNSGTTNPCQPAPITFGGWTGCPAQQFNCTGGGATLNGGPGRNVSGNTKCGSVTVSAACGGKTFPCGPNVAVGAPDE